MSNKNQPSISLTHAGYIVTEATESPHAAPKPSDPPNPSTQQSECSTEQARPTAEGEDADRYLGRILAELYMVREGITHEGVVHGEPIFCGDAEFKPTFEDLRDMYRESLKNDENDKINQSIDLALEAGNAVSHLSEEYWQAVNELHVLRAKVKRLQADSEAYHAIMKAFGNISHD